MVLYSITWLCVALILYKKITKECENRFKGSFYHNTCRVKKINRFFENNLFWDTLMRMLEIQKYSGNDLCHLLQSFCPETADSWQQQSPSCDFIAYQIICRTTQKERCQNPVIKQTDIWRWKDMVEPFPSPAEVDQNALSRSLEPVWIWETLTFNSR